MNANFMKESKTIDYVVSLGLEAVKDKVKTEWEAKQVRDRLKNYISRQQKINWSCTREEEIDFGGLTHYIQTDLLDDVQERLFGNREERGMARTSIISKATCYAQAHTSLSRQRAIWMTETAIDILHEFYKSRINRELKFIAAQIEDAVGEIATEQTKEIVQTVQASEERVIKELKNAAKNIGNMSIEKNMQLMRQGDIGQVEDTVSNFFAAIGSTHILFPNYRYEYKGEKGQLYSKPLTKEALEKYPPRISCTGTIQMTGKYLQKFDVNTIDYANRHQLPITLNVITAKKLLGNIDDPIQHEAEKLIGESFIIQPKPFPPAFPCSISLDGNVMFDYILFRTEEILDDGTIIISNREQENCPFRIGMSVNMKLGKTTYSVDTVEPTNEELLQYLRFLTRADRGETISIKVLLLGEELATGKLGNVKYRSGFDKIETEMDFLEKIVAIEHYYNDTISIPEEIMLDDFQAISYLYSLINGEECTGSWSKLDFSMALTEELKQRISESDDTKFALSYVGSINVSFYGKSYELSVIRTFDSVVYQDIERLKKKAEILDVGDTIKLVFLPGSKENGTWRDRINTDEI